MPHGLADNGRLGVGAPLPQEAQDRSLLRRALASDDKLLQQLVGRRTAKAHIAARQAPKAKARSQKAGPPVPATTKVDESEDEEEGRAAAFKSNKHNAEPTKETAGARQSNHRPQKSRRIPTSYLDQILAERAKKKKKRERPYST